MKWALLLALLLAAQFALAGFNDMVFSSPQANGQFHQGDYLNFTLVLNNTGILDGGAVYVANVTLGPELCINNGVPITIPGAIVCTETAQDTSCAQRFVRAFRANVFNFTNVSTVEGCNSGRYKLHFTVSGTSEVGNGGTFSTVPKTKTQEFEMDFVGQLACGDGICTTWKGENCTRCPQDCGRCPECAPGAKACVNDSAAECDARGFWQMTEFCVAGCHLVNETPQCLEPCIDGTKTCTSEDVLAVCVAKRWENRTCPYGCIFDDCKGNCDVAGCADRCMGGVLYSQGTCDHVRGVCGYAKNETCGQGCNEDGSGCAGQGGGGGGGADLMLIIGAVVVVVLAAVAYFKFARKKKEEPPPLQEFKPPF